MAEIKVLSQEVANMIAAGEVVERPASVVKELLENAVDAGADKITVEIKKGGIELMSVVDNGCGISENQLETAFLRHATSKLRSAENLTNISTLGFRGEALAAIAAVSKIEAISSVKDGDVAWKIHLEAGNLLEKAEVAAPVGTQILVCDLFFNTPARKKFLKSEKAEGAAIFALVQEVALSNPGISIRFIRDGKEDLNTWGDGVLSTAIFHVLGKNIASGLREIEASNLDTSLEGFVSLPSCCRASRNFQHFFVNGRYVKSPMLSAALEEAYRNQKMVGKFPAAVLHLRLNYDEVDVNVHPAKTQVKFVHEKEIFQIVYRGVLKGLEAHKDIQKVVLEPNITNIKNDTKNEYVEQDLLKEEEPPKVETENRFTFHSPVVRERASTLSDVLPDFSMNPSDLPEEEVKIPSISPEFAFKPERTTQKVNVVFSSANEEYEEIPLDPEVEKPQWRVVGEFFRTYIAVEQGDEIFLIDKHAAHERLNFNRLKSQNYVPMAQTLLKPVVLQLAPVEQEALLSNLSLLEEFSFEIEEFSKESIIIRQVPYDIPEEKAGETLVEIARKLISGQAPDPLAARDHVLHSIACKAAIKAGYHTLEEEQRAVAELAMEDQVRHCPHGRPILASLSKQELERKFKRQV